MDSHAGVTIKEYDHIGLVDENAWNRLAGEAPSAATGWLRTVESTYAGAILPRYLTAEKGCGRIIGAAVCYLVDKGPVAGDFDHAVLGRLKRHAHKLGISWMPVVMC